MKRIVFTLLLSLSATAAAFACTSAIVSANKTLNGRPLLWKHRDTGEENNKVERTPAGEGVFEHVALYLSLIHI